MNLPQVLTALVEAQNKLDSAAFSECFTESAIVFDEGKTYRGRKEIQNWIDKANKEFQTSMKPLEYSEAEKQLKAEIAGSFPGSPLVLTYQYDFDKGLIQSLKIA
ncbi:nuclear transport factor 2 family protein [Algoriphagus sp. H41]|uniref:Nuclear transport factor 2 family protein n=1 Tax=Algoriphagus oliviformis TaxID=2811231 RepID=A0ABS3C400_9BACT|nr:nuclear transport factor 2 family protein [Algoriphagus oliviformis]MBN7811838.1 nuclear transport factor 2 family protein [Algoriphagus oliviformis]